MKKYKGASQRALQEMIGASGEACEVCLPVWRSTQRARLVLVKGSKWQKGWKKQSGWTHNTNLWM